MMPRDHKRDWKLRYEQELARRRSEQAIAAAAYAARPDREKPADRRCLGCARVFRSQSCANRLCPLCHKREVMAVA